MSHLIDTTSPIILSDPLNRQHPLLRGRQASWMVLPGLDGGNKVYDAVGSGHITLNPAATLASSWSSIPSPGGYGSLDTSVATNLPGTTAPLNITGPPITIMTWIRPISFSLYQWVIRENSAHGGIGVGGTVGQLAYWWEGTSDEYDFASGLGPVVKEWSLAAVTIAPTAAILYLVNSTGISQAVNTKTHTAHTMGAATIGSNVSGANQLWKGQYNDISIYNRILTPAEIKQYYDISKEGYPGMFNRLPYRLMDGQSAVVSRLPRNIITPVPLSYQHQLAYYD
jgi:hypothetical protein